MSEKGVSFVVVSGDMIEGTVTATLLNRARPGALEARREAAGRLYSVEEFASEVAAMRSEEHTSELQSRGHLVCRLLLEKKKKESDQNKRARVSTTNASSRQDT